MNELKNEKLELEITVNEQKNALKMIRTSLLRSPQSQDLTSLNSFASTRSDKSIMLANIFNSSNLSSAMASSMMDLSMISDCNSVLKDSSLTSTSSVKDKSGQKTHNFED